MKISYRWLQDYIQCTETPQAIESTLTQTGLEVGSIASFRLFPSELVIGHVLTCEPHPNAERLKKTTVDVGNGNPLPIVCGAPNVAAGQKVVVAPVGTTLHMYNGETLKIKKAKIREEISEGMICAEDELGLSPNHDQIMVLETDLPAGTPLEQYFKTPEDAVLEVDVTPNRTDAFCHIGVARDLGAVWQVPIQYPDFPPIVQESPSLPIRVRILNPTAVPRYAGVVLDNIAVGESPVWLKNKLRTIGVNPVNNVVDVTNFVLHELGQPLHAFDYDKIAGAQLTICQDIKGSFVGLDGKTRSLNGEELMISDEAGPLCMAGIIGGTRAAVTRETQRIFLESAYFNATIIGKSAKRYGISTDASFRYERGTDPNGVLRALERACALLKRVTGAQVASSVIDLYPEPIRPCQVTVRYDHIDRLIGKKIPIDTIHRILQALEIMVSHESGDQFLATIPTYRVDVVREADVIEEILRIYGYDRVEVTGRLSSAYLAETIPPVPHKIQQDITKLLVANGYYEIKTNPLTAAAPEGQLDVPEEAFKSVTVVNPLSETHSRLRNHLLPGGLAVIAHNIHRGQTDLKLFEFGKAYAQHDATYQETSHLGIWITGNLEEANWIRAARPVTFQDLKAMIYKILQKKGFSNPDAQVVEHPYYEKMLTLAYEGRPLARLGRVKPALLRQYGVHQEAFFADIAWYGLVNTIVPPLQYKEIPKYPAVHRDLSLVIDKAVSFEHLCNLVHQHLPEAILRQIPQFNLVDMYEGDRIDADKKAYTLNFVLQSSKKTLTDREIDAIMTQLMELFETKAGALIRR